MITLRTTSLFIAAVFAVIALSSPADAARRPPPDTSGSGTKLVVSPA